jgi:hypothetical protein
MAAEPGVKRAIAFFDGQNLFYAAKYAFGYSWPNYDPLKLAQAVCRAQGWQLTTNHEAHEGHEDHGTADERR